MKMDQMQAISSVTFSGVFALRDGVSETEFLPRLHTFFQHFIDMGFATGYRVMRREALDGFGKTLPAFAYRGELNGQTRRGLLFRDAYRVEHECLPLGPELTSSVVAAETFASLPIAAPL